MKKLFLFIILIITLGMGVLKSYLEIAPTSTVTFEKEESLVYAIDDIPDTISSSDILSKEEEDLICSIFSGLVELNEEGEPIPDLAKAWKLSEDGLEYTFKIKENIKWSNGEEITAESFQMFFRDLLSPDNDSYTSDELNTIYGVKEYREGKHDFSKVAINTPDKYTITIRMNNKDDELLEKLSKPVYRLRNLNDPLDNYKLEFNKISYTGPYIIEEVTEDGFIKLTYNPYSDIEVEIEEILLKEKEGDEMELAAFNLNKVDILRNPPAINSDEFGLYKDTSVYRNDIVNIMVMNENIKDSMHILLKNWINESNIIKNNLGSAYVEVLNRNNIGNIFQDKNEEELSGGIDHNYKKKVQEGFNEILESKGVLKIVINDNEENKVFANELKEELEEYNVKSTIKIYKDDFKEILESEDFDIALIDADKKSIDSFFKSEKNEGSTETLNSDNKNEDETTDKNETVQSKVAMSIYLKNDLWCKSDRVNYTYIDGNGNLILKYSSY